MRGSWTIAVRELRSFYRLPVGWVVSALFLALSGSVFALETLRPGEPATMRTFFGVSSVLLMWIAPAVSMRLLSEEKRSGTIEPLTTAPVGEFAIVWGKYMGGVLFMCLALAPTLVYPIGLMFVSEPGPDVGPIFAGYVSLGLAGLVYLAFGLVASALTSSQTLAYLGALLGLFGLQVLSVRVAGQVPAPWSEWMAALSIESRVNDFAAGVIDFGNVVSLLAMTAWLVCLAYVALGLRRWR